MLRSGKPLERSATENEAYFSQNIATCGSGSVGYRCRKTPVIITRWGIHAVDSPIFLI